MATLLRASLLARREDAAAAVVIHPLVACVARSWLALDVDGLDARVVAALTERLASAGDIRSHGALMFDVAQAQGLHTTLHPRGVALGLRLGRFHTARGAYGAARLVEERCLAAAERLLGDEHPDTLTSMNNLAYTLRKLGQRESAAQTMRVAVEGRIKVLGMGHKHTASSVQALEAMQTALASSLSDPY